jgi:hypothetical protein
MSFLTPLFLLGAAGIAVPILVHLIQRERKNVVAFPSLMFVQRIPYQSVRRRRIRHWYLLLMRIAAIILIVAAFARPFLPQRAAAAVAAVGGNRELVVLLDRSASMGYGDRFARAQEAARSAVSSIGMNDKATLVLFDRDTEEAVRATSDRGRLESAIRDAKVNASGTRFGPALKFAEGVLSRSTLQRREAVLISDFQKTGWSGGEDLHFAKNMTLTTVPITDEKPSNISVPSVTFQRSEFSGKELVRVTAGVANKGLPAGAVKVSLEIDGHELESQNVSVGSNASTSVSFQPFPLIESTARGVVRAGTDAMPADNTFNFIVTPSQSISVLIIDSGGRTDPEGSSYHLLKALSIGNNPAFKVETLPAARVTPEQLERRAVVILNDAVVPPGIAGGELKRFVERGNGLLVAFGEHSGSAQTEADLLPGTLGKTVDRLDSRGGTIGTRDYSHKVFEIFKAQRSGDFSRVRIFRYRSLTPGKDDRVLASYDDGAVAAAERRIGNGRVIVLTTSLDTSWTDFPNSSVFLPLVQQTVKYLAHYEPPSAWSTVGQAVDLAARFKGKADRIVVTPTNERRTVRSNESSVLELNEQGVYEVRAAASGSGRPDRIAVNIDPVESDLAPMDPQELVAAVTGLANPNAVNRTADEDNTLTPADAERRQSLWWYLLILGLALLATEMVIANRLSEHERFT